MPEIAMAEMTYKDRLKLDLFPTIWCPGCGIGTIMMQLAMTLDEMRLDERNTIIVTGIGCTGRMGGYLKHEAVYTLHGRTLPVAEAIKTVRPEMNVIVVAGDGDTASIGGNHLIHSIRRNAPGHGPLQQQRDLRAHRGPDRADHARPARRPSARPAATRTRRSTCRAWCARARTRCTRRPPSTTSCTCATRSARRSSGPGFSFVDITSQCIENNGRRIGFASANDMLTFYRKTYKRAAKDADRLDPFEIGIVYPAAHPSRNGHEPERPDALPEQPAGPLASATESPGEEGATAPEAATAVVERTDDEKARRRAESVERAALMAKLDPEVKMRVAKREITLAAGTRRRPASRSRNGCGPVPRRRMPHSVRGRGPPPVASTSGAADPKEAKKAEAQRKLALMQRLPSELKLRVAKREISLEDAMREAGVEPE